MDTVVDVLPLCPWCGRDNLSHDDKVNLAPSERTAKCSFDDCKFSIPLAFAKSPNSLANAVKNREFALRSAIQKANDAKLLLRLRKDGNAVEMSKFQINCPCCTKEKKMTNHPSVQSPLDPYMICEDCGFILPQSKKNDEASIAIAASNYISLLELKAMNDAESAEKLEKMQTA